MSGFRPPDWHERERISGIIELDFGKGFLKSLLETHILRGGNPLLYGQGQYASY